MTVTVLLFASYADALGASSLDLELPRRLDGWRLLVARCARCPARERLPPTPLVAVNAGVRDRATAWLRAGDEVAIIPPVAGG